MIPTVNVPKPLEEATHAEELARLRKMITEKVSSPKKREERMFDEGVMTVSNSGRHMKLNPLKLMDRSELTNELNVTLTVATLLLGVVLSLMVSVSREEMEKAILEDMLSCSAQRCIVQPAYDKFIYLSGIVTTEICGGCMITVVSLQYSFNLLSVNSRDLIGGGVEYHTYRSVVGVMHLLILISFVATCFCGLNVIFVKIRDFRLQVTLFYISCSFWATLVGITSYVTRLHWIARAHLKELYNVRAMEMSLYEKRIVENLEYDGHLHQVESGH